MHVFLHEDQHEPLQVEPVQELGLHLALLSQWFRHTAEQLELHFALHPVLLLPPLLGLFSSQLLRNAGNIASPKTGREFIAACLKKSLRDCNSQVSIILSFNTFPKSVESVPTQLLTHPQSLITSSYQSRCLNMWFYNHNDSDRSNRLDNCFCRCNHNLSFRQLG